MKNIDKQILGLAGEYWTAAELCRRGVYAQLTLGHHKQTDILVETEYIMLRIQVKTKRGDEWPSVRGIYRENDILVLVDTKNKDDTARPDFYILDIDDWKKLIQKEKERYPSVNIDKNKLQIKYPDGWTGLNIKLSDVQRHKEKWEKITEKYKQK